MCKAALKTQQRCCSMTHAVKQVVLHQWHMHSMHAHSHAPVTAQHQQAESFQAGYASANMPYDSSNECI
jgi:hypothetical protein